MKSRVEELLRTEPYDQIDKKFMPFILNSLGIDTQPQIKNISCWSISQSLLKSSSFVESLQFIL